MKFNRNKPFGIITPPWQGASYQQGDHYFDGGYKRIPSLSAKPKLRELMPVDTAPMGSVEANLIRMSTSSEMSWPEFKKQARECLDECPATKEKIVEALKEQIINGVMESSPQENSSDTEEDSADTSDTEEFQGMTWDEKPDPAPSADNEETEEEAEDEEESEAEEELSSEDDASEDESEEMDEDPNDGPVNLSLWGRGKANYLFSDVQTEIRNRFSRQVSEKRDAINLLVDEGVIADNEAMRLE